MGKVIRRKDMREVKMVSRRWTYPMTLLPMFLERTDDRRTSYFVNLFDF
jgi:hypothetical protein